MASTEQQTETRQAAQLYLAVIRRAQQYPEGREVLATLLRECGWRCTPPTTAPKPARKGRG